MSVADSGRELASVILAAPFAAILLAAAGKIMYVVYQATRIGGSGKFAQLQESVYSSSTLALNLLELASSIETWVLLVAFIFAVMTGIRSMGSRGGF
jgi:hypothetical protein